MSAPLNLKPEIPLPPESLMFMGETHDQMMVNAISLLDFPTRLGICGPDVPILDVGCGYGRLAYGLLQSGHRAPYFGIDILPRHIAWLRENLKPHLPAGSDFARLNVLNGRYNPNGAISASEATLPGPEWTPGLALLFSVFTHMYPDDVEHYVAEVRRSIPVGAVACVTFFLLNRESLRLQSGPKSRFNFQHRLSDTCFYINEQDPLHAIAFDEAWVYGMLQANSMQIEHVAYGAWCARFGARVFQDTMILRRIS